ncbi:hypothetical protein VPH35_087749 [Triticum aestivum]
MHKFNCGMHTHFGVTQLELYHRSFFSHVMPSNLYYCSSSIDKSNLPQILYEDDDHNKVMLSSDSDHIATVYHAKQIAWKVIRGKFNLHSTKSATHHINWKLKS